MNSQKSNCPACGYYLSFPAWDGLSASDEICPCCGIHYGNDDFAGGDTKERNLIYEKWRNEWIENGMHWRSMGIVPPVNWNPVKQLNYFKKNTE